MEQAPPDIKNAVAAKTNAVALYSSLTNDSAHSKLVFINKIVSLPEEVKQAFRLAKHYASLLFVC